MKTSETINTIVGGMMPDTPRSLLYAGFEFQIPENSQILKIKDKTKFLLYCRTDFIDISIINNPHFHKYYMREKIQGGFPLETLCQNIDWVFDSQRSFTTRDGRLYVESIYFHTDWRWYLNAVPLIIEDCKKIFKEKCKEELNKNPKRAW